MNLWDVRCTQPASSYKPGPCHGLLFRISSTGGLEVKCHRCHDVQIIHKDELSRYTVEHAFAD